MLSKEILDELIKRRYDERKTLSIEKIEGEKYSKWQIKTSADKYYGGWANARNEVVGVSKHAHKPDMTRGEVVQELRRLQSEGHSMKAADFEPWFYLRITEHFGGYKQAKEVLGIVQERHKNSFNKTRPMSEVVAELKRIDTTQYNKRTFRENYRHILDYSRRHLGDQYYIFEKADVTIPKDTKRAPRKSKYSERDMRKGLEEAISAHKIASSAVLRQNGFGWLVHAVKRQYGTWNAGLVALGYEVAYEYRSPDDNLTKKETKEKVLHSLAKGVNPTRRALEKSIQGLKRSIEVNFGGIVELKEYCGFCALTDRPQEHKSMSRKYCPRLTTSEGIRREIIRMWYIGVPLNYTFIREKRRYLLDAVNTLMGSWKKAVESVGIDYVQISKQSDTNILSECGTEFEEIFEEILTELDYEFLREGDKVGEIIPGFSLKPDFILPNWRWIDCKLSEWTDVRETIIRYSDEKPNGITIVYLRGRNRRVDRGRKWKYEHVSVYQFTKLLPKERREYFESKLRVIERKANEGAVAS